MTFKIGVFSLCMMSCLPSWADNEQPAFDAGTAYGESQINSAMDTLKGLNPNDLGTSNSAASQAQQALNEAQKNNPNATVDNSIMTEGDAIEENAPQTVQDSGTFCNSGDCKDTKTTPSDDFDSGGSELSGTVAAGEDMKKEQENLPVYNEQIAAILPVKAYGGASVSCTYDSASFKNCCAEKGAAIHLGFSCSNTEKELAKAVQEDRTIYVGTYCSKKMPLVGCIAHKKVYCEFSLLNRIIQEDGRWGQLHINFGVVNDDNHNANCRGLYPDEIEKIDFDQCDSAHPSPNCIDYTEYYAEMESKLTVPAEAGG